MHAANKVPSRGSRDRPGPRVRDAKSDDAGRLTFPPPSVFLNPKTREQNEIEKECKTPYRYTRRAHTAVAVWHTHTAVAHFGLCTGAAQPSRTEPEHPCAVNPARPTRAIQKRKKDISMHLAHYFLTQHSLDMCGHLIHSQHSVTQPRTNTRDTTRRGEYRATRRPTTAMHDGTPWPCPLCSLTPPHRRGQVARRVVH